MAQEALCSDHSAHILSVLRRKIRLLCSRIRWLIRKRPRLKIVVKRLRRFGSRVRSGESLGSKNRSANGQFSFSFPERPIRVATFNVAMFSLAPAVPNESSMLDQEEDEEDYFVFGNNQQKPRGLNSQPRSILKQSPLHPSVNGRPARSNLKVSINLPENEISIANSKLFGFIQANEAMSSPIMITNSTNTRSKVPVRSPICFPYSLGMGISRSDQEENLRSGKSILEVLREVNADILALQDVKAEEEKGMRPLSDLASALGMDYVFAESWAPEYGNAILSRWPIKRWRVQKIADDDDFRCLFSHLIIIFPEIIALVKEKHIRALQRLPCRHFNRVLQGSISNFLIWKTKSVIWHISRFLATDNLLRGICALFLV